MIAINALWLVFLFLLCASIWVGKSNALKESGLSYFIGLLDVLWICWALIDFGIFLSHHITITF
jgi:hypothetical protein